MKSSPKAVTPARADAVEAVRALARAARVLERASRELSMPHYRVLAAVAAGEERASRVAERLELGRPAVSAAVEALTREGLLIRAGVEGDQRAFDLALTDKGWTVFTRVETEMVRALDLLCGDLPEGAAVVAALARLGRAVDDMYADRAARQQRSAT